MKMYVYKYFYGSKSFVKKSFDVKRVFADVDLLFKFPDELGLGDCYETANIISYMQGKLFSVRELSKEEEKKFIKYISL
jgi:hypothetical protein